MACQDGTLVCPDDSLGMADLLQLWEKKMSSLQYASCAVLVILGWTYGLEPSWWDANPEGVCTDDLLLGKPGFLLSTIRSHTLRWFSVAPLVFLFRGFLPLQLNQIWRILYKMFGEEGGGTLFVCLQTLYLTDMF
jgi:hypothetical protein